MISIFRVSLASIAVVLALSSTAIGKELKVGSKFELSTLDPHFFASFPSGTSHSYIYDRLVGLDANLNLVPALAESWRAIDATTWEFKLRQGVKFHDGSDFTADDVIATFERIPEVPDSPNSFTKFVRRASKIETPDPHTMIISTEQPAPTLARDFSNVIIISAEMKDATTKEFNDGKAIGTGPYKLLEWKRGQSLILERFEDYWGDKPEWDQVEEVVLTNDGARTAALLAGDVDVINYAPVEDIARLRESPEFDVFSGALARIHYIAMDSNRNPTPHVDAGDKPNPLQNPSVRKALSLAINRQAIVERLLLGLGAPASQLLPKSNAGMSQNLEVDPYDPQAAKKLLEDAGYGDGFALTFHATNGRYPADVEIAQAVAQMWTRIGLNVSVEALARTIFFPKATKFEFSLYTAQYGADDAGDMATSMLHTRDKEKGLGNGNRARYSNAEVDKYIDLAAVELDPKKREEYLAQVYEITHSEHGVIPLYHPSFVCAARADLNVEIFANGRMTAAQVTSR